VQNAPDGYLDLWAREHYKSTIITFGKTLQDILASHGEDPITDQEVTVGIFSHNRPTAVKFLQHIKNEMERNERLRELFPDIIWENPGKDAPKWSVYSGLVVRRKSNPKEATIEAYGLVDGMPTGGHFNLLVYDDVVTLDVVRSPDMIAKVTESLGMSYNLGARGGRRRMIGTRYHFADTYKTVMDRMTFVPRIHAATHNGELDGEPALLTRGELETKRRDQGPYVFACQMMQNPAVDSAHGFKREWLRFYHDSHEGAGMNKYLVVDPASAKKKDSDYTAMAVIGLAADKNYYLLDFIYDRLNLTERTQSLFRLHRKWTPRITGYEKYGKDSDVEHIEFVQNLENYRFDVTPLGGQLKKEDRIKRLIPIFEDSRFYFPHELFKVDYEGKSLDVIEKLLTEEYDLFPVGMHDDGMDAIARILDEDMQAQWPRLVDDTPKREGRYGRVRAGSGWSA
jgi:predicted phage terminase large subunit-like protein